jgi:amino-acid N-acetyltransferase
MESEIITIISDEDFESFRTLLRSSNLSADDLSLHRDLLIAYREDGQLVGTGALEIYGHDGLLRSLSVRLGTRGKALGTQLTDYLIAEARNRGLKHIYLLTETARGFFQRKGFTDISRNEVPAALQASSEFSGPRPKVPVAMKLDLNSPH